MKELYKLLGIEGNPSTAYHPQTDGQTERVNQEVEIYLRAFVNHHQSDWVEWLALAEFAYNNREHSSTKQSPFFVNYGRHPYQGTSPKRESNNESAQDFAQRMASVHKEAQLALKEAATEMKKYYDRKRLPSRQYKPGDKVMLEAKHITSDRPMKKLDHKRYGPFIVKKKVGEAAYLLQLPATWRRIHPVINEDLLSPYLGPAFPSQKVPPPPSPELIEGHQEYIVENIVDSRIHRGGLQYLVHWKGYPVAERTWEPVRNVANSKQLVDKFHQEHPGAPRPLLPRQARALYYSLRPTGAFQDLGNWWKPIEDDRLEGGGDVMNL